MTPASASQDATEPVPKPKDENYLLALSQQKPSLRVDTSADDVDESEGDPEETESVVNTAVSAANAIGDRMRLLKSKFLGGSATPSETESSATTSPVTKTLSKSQKKNLKKKAAKAAGK